MTRRNARPSYAAAWISAAGGIGLVLFGILAASDGATVGGIFLGAGSLGVAVLYTFEVRQARRGTPPDTLDERAVERLTRDQPDTYR